jgi:hypothetical protein
MATFDARWKQTPTPLKLRKGETFDIEFEVLDSNGDPIDLSAFTVLKLQFEKSAKDNDASAIKSMDLTSAVSGTSNQKVRATDVFPFDERNIPITYMVSIRILGVAICIGEQ